MSGDLTRLTAARQFVGTFTYAAPEQLLGGAMDARSDQYSLAVVAYEMLTGRPPHDADDPAKMIRALMTRRIAPPSSLREGLPKWVDLVLGRALAQAPEDRYESIAAFGQAMHSGSRHSRATTAVAGGTPAAPAGGGLLGMYELGDRLGPGRLGSEVFRGTHRALGHPVAIRLLRRGPDRSWDAVRARFLREAQTLQLAHPSIIQVRDYGEEGDLVYLVTDYIDGPSLREVLTREGAMAWARLKPLLAQLVSAARALHRKGGLLCGVSPDIMRVACDEDGEVLMISTAGIWSAQDLLGTLNDATLRGSPLEDLELHYVAPELLTGQSADVRSDVFTMAVVAYEMASAALPYNGATMPALLGEMLRGRPPDPRERQPGLPDAAAAALLKALSAAPADRFESAKAFGDAMLS
jgi:serine/threonine protein kinase